MIARAVPALLAVALAAACTEDPVVLATVPDDHGGPGAPETRCVRNEDCPAGTFCDRPACDAPGGTCHPFPVECPNDEAPVCGCDGVTYFNDCLRHAAGATKAHDRECDADARGCRAPGDCPSGGSCARLAGLDAASCGPDLPGRCWVVPATCPPPGPDRWVTCAPPPPPGPEPPPPPPCLDTCSAIHVGMPFHRALSCP